MIAQFRMAALRRSTPAVVAMRHAGTSALLAKAAPGRADNLHKQASVATNRLLEDLAKHNTASTAVKKPVPSASSTAYPAGHAARSEPPAGTTGQLRMRRTERAAASAAELQSMILGLNEVPALLRFAMTHLDNQSGFNVVVASLLLARVAASFRPSTTADVTAVNSEAFGALTAYIRKRLVIGQAFAGARGVEHLPDAAAVAIDPRVLSSIMHSLAKLAATRRIPDLFKQCLELGAERLGYFPPRSLAMFAWAAAKYGYACPEHEPLYRRISDVSVSAAVAHWPAYVPPGTSPAAATSRFEPAECAMLLSAYATAGLKAPQPYERLIGVLQPLLPYCTQASLTSAVWAVASAPIRTPSLSHSLSQPSSTSDAISTFMRSAGREAAVRLHQRMRRNGGVGGVGGSNAVDSDVEHDGGEGGDVDREEIDKVRAALAQMRAEGGDEDVTLKLEHLHARLRTQGGNDEFACDASAAGGALDPHSDRAKPFTPRTLATVLHAFASHGHRSEELFRAASVYLSAVSAESGTDTGGAEGYRPLGSHRGDVPAAHSHARRRSEREDASGDVAVVSVYDSESIASIAWSFARIKYTDDRTPALWAAMLATMQQRVRADVRRRLRPVDATSDAVIAGERREGTSQSSSGSSTGGKGKRMRPHYAVSVLWAASRASILAPQLAHATLEQLAVASPASISVPALCQLMWACTLQGVYEPRTWTALFSHVLDMTDLQVKRNPRPGMNAKDPDAIAAYLGEPLGSAAPAHTGAHKLRSQLYMANLGATLEAGWSSCVPPSILSSWRSAYLASNPRVSKLQGEVAKSLRTACKEVLVEHVTPEGLLVDVYLPPGSCGEETPPTATATNAKSAVSAGGVVGSATRGWVVEVQGPSHFCQGIDTVLHNAHASSQHRGQAGSVTVTPAGVLPGMDDYHTVPSNTSIDNEGGGAATALVPTLSTRAKLRWLAKSGYSVVAVNWQEWQEYPSTQERLELLASKGLPIQSKYLSY